MSLTSKQLEGMRVLHNRVLVKKDAIPEKTAGGIHIPNVYPRFQDRGVVVAKGEGATVQEKVGLAEIPVGARVVFNKMSGSPHKVDGEDYQLIRHDDIWCVIEEEAT